MLSTKNKGLLGVGQSQTPSQNNAPAFQSVAQALKLTQKRMKSSNFRQEEHQLYPKIFYPSSKPSYQRTRTALSGASLPGHHIIDALSIENFDVKSSEVPERDAELETSSRLRTKDMSDIVKLRNEKELQQVYDRAVALREVHPSDLKMLNSEFAEISQIDGRVKSGWLSPHSPQSAGLTGSAGGSAGEDS